MLKTSYLNPDHMNQSRTMKLYLATASNEDGENLDLFIVAASPTEAGQMLIDHWAKGEVEIAQSSGIVVHNVPGQPLPNAVEGIVDWSQIPCEEPQLNCPDTSSWWCNGEDEN
jgi:hypothetical protein